MNTATCIVGYRNKKSKKVYIGGDSAGTDGTDIRIRKDSKVFIKGSMVFGFTSSFRMGQILRYKLSIPPRSQYRDMDDLEFMSTVFIDTVRKYLKENGFITIKDNAEKAGTFIVGYNGNLYQVFNDLQVAQYHDDFCACGCGENYAMGYLYAVKGFAVSVEKKVTGALECAHSFSAGVRPPFNILSI